MIKKLAIPTLCLAIGAAAGFAAAARLDVLEYCAGVAAGIQSDRLGFCPVDTYEGEPGAVDCLARHTCILGDDE